MGHGVFFTLKIFRGLRYAPVGRGCGPLGVYCLRVAVTG
nr:MAG TPA: hypothetical protein [Caudoviricetes sp.]